MQHIFCCCCILCTIIRSRVTVHTRMPSTPLNIKFKDIVDPMRMKFSQLSQAAVLLSHLSLASCMRASVNLCSMHDEQDSCMECFELYCMQLVCRQIHAGCLSRLFQLAAISMQGGYVPIYRYLQCVSLDSPSFVSLYPDIQAIYVHVIDVEL